MQDTRNGLAQNSLRWGVVATILAPPQQIVEFCAYHLRAGAAQIYVYLDDPAIALPYALFSDPRISVIRCDAAHWSKIAQRRPPQHQTRQSRNANHAYRRAANLDWLIHMDVDEFLVGADVAHALNPLPSDAFCARIRPLEAMCPPNGGAPTLFKRPVRKGPGYNETMGQLYPNWGGQVRGGFLSHVVGKLFVRTGQHGLKIKIHNAFLNGAENPGLVLLDDLELAHLHAPSWEAFTASYSYRLAHGSYREGLAPNRPRDLGGVTLHELFSAAQHDADGETLRSIYDELCLARPELVHALENRGLLLRANLQRKDAIASQFPALFDPSPLAC